MGTRVGVIRVVLICCGLFQVAMTVAGVPAGLVAAPGLGGAPAEIRQLPERIGVFDWPGAWPPGAAPIGSATDPAPVEVLRHAGALFIIVPQSRSLFGDYIRVSALADGTVVRLNGRIAARLAAGEEWLFTPGWMRLRIDATDPVVVSFFVVPGN